MVLFWPYTAQGHLHQQGTPALTPETFCDSGICDLKELAISLTDHGQCTKCCHDSYSLYSPGNKSQQWWLLFLIMQYIPHSECRSVKQLPIAVTLITLYNTTDYPLQYH